MDPAVAGPRLGRLAVRKRQSISELAHRPVATVLAIGQGAVGRFRQIAGVLRYQLLEAQVLEIDTDPASQIIRATVRRFNVTPIDDADSQAPEIEGAVWQSMLVTRRAPSIALAPRRSGSRAACATGLIGTMEYPPRGTSTFRKPCFRHSVGQTVGH